MRSSCALKRANERRECRQWTHIIWLVVAMTKPGGRERPRHICACVCVCMFVRGDVEQQEVTGWCAWVIGVDVCVCVWQCSRPCLRWRRWWEPSWESTDGRTDERCTCAQSKCVWFGGDMCLVRFYLWPENETHMAKTFIQLFKYVKSNPIDILYRSTYKKKSYKSFHNFIPKWSILLSIGHIGCVVYAVKVILI